MCQWIFWCFTYVADNFEARLLEHMAQMLALLQAKNSVGYRWDSNADSCRYLCIYVARYNVCVYRNKYRKCCQKLKCCFSSFLERWCPLLKNEYAHLSLHIPLKCYILDTLSDKLINVVLIGWQYIYLQIPAAWCQYLLLCCVNTIVNCSLQDTPCCHTSFC